MDPSFPWIRFKLGHCNQIHDHSFIIIGPEFLVLTTVTIAPFLFSGIYIFRITFFSVNSWWKTSLVCRFCMTVTVTVAVFCITDYMHNRALQSQYSGPLELIFHYSHSCSHGKHSLNDFKKFSSMTVTEIHVSN